MSDSYTTHYAPPCYTTLRLFTPDYDYDQVIIEVDAWEGPPKDADTAIRQRWTLPGSVCKAIQDGDEDVLYHAAKLFEAMRRRYD